MEQGDQAEKIKGFVRERYGRLALEGRGCCGPGEEKLLQIGYASDELETLPEGAVAVGAGCGNPTAFADLKEGEVVLDLGSGGGIDALLAAKKVGPKGRVIGVDMTPEMVERARRNAEGMGASNVEFRVGEIERLPVEGGSVDVIISNCVINLAPDKDKVFQEASRVLKPGGRMIISDMVAKRKLPGWVLRNLEAWAGCVAGALEQEEYLQKIRQAGFQTVEILSEAQLSSPVPLSSVTVKAAKALKQGGSDGGDHRTGQQG